MTESSDVEFFIFFDGGKDQIPWPDSTYGDANSAYDFNEGSVHRIWRRKLFRTKNPFAAKPKVRPRCVKWAKPWPGAKICVGHKYQWKYMYTSGILIVSLKGDKNARVAIEECLKDAASAAAIAAIVGAIASGGAGVGVATDIFVKIFTACLVSKLGQDLLSVDLDLQHAWGDWE